MNKISHGNRPRFAPDAPKAKERNVWDAFNLAALSFVGGLILFSLILEIGA